MIKISDLFLVMAGGSFGTYARYLFGEIFNQHIARNFIWFARFPAATFSINFLGCFLAGILYFWLTHASFAASLSINSAIRKFALIGFLGGFTTFSTFSLDFLRLIESGQLFTAFLYGLTSLVLCLVAVFLGFYLASYFSFEL